MDSTYTAFPITKLETFTFSAKGKKLVTGRDARNNACRPLGNVLYTLTTSRDDNLVLLPPYWNAVMLVPLRMISHFFRNK
jgi:hypothetical protein